MLVKTYIYTCPITTVINLGFYLEKVGKSNPLALRQGVWKAGGR